MSLYGYDSPSENPGPWRWFRCDLRRCIVCGLLIHTPPFLSTYSLSVHCGRRTVHIEDHWHHGPPLEKRLA